jgi:hypothetical protein
MVEGVDIQILKDLICFTLYERKLRNRLTEREKFRETERQGFIMMQRIDLWSFHRP